MVGVILNPALTFAGHALCPTADGRFDWFITILAPAAFLALQRGKAGLLPVMGCCALAGVGFSLIPP